MNVHQFITAAAEKGWLKTIDKPVSTELELAAVAYALDGSPVLFEDVRFPTSDLLFPTSSYPILTRLASHRWYFALVLGCQPDQILFRLADAFQNPQPAPIVEAGTEPAPCQEVVEQPGDLTAIPFLKHWETDAGLYATAAIAIINDPDTGPTSPTIAAAPGRHL